MTKIEQTISRITELNKSKMISCKEKLDNLTKPIGSMGVLEDIAMSLSGIYGEIPAQYPKSILIIMAGDHGHVAEGISGYPQSVTKEMVHNILSGGAGVNVLLNANNSGFALVDVGINGEIHCDGLIDKKVLNGTNNMAIGPAMSYEDAICSINAGIDTANEFIDKGYTLLGIGEMGVGNTTASSAILHAFSGLDVETIVDRGAGISDKSLIRKKEVVKSAVENNSPNTEDAIDVLAKVGGLEIGAMAGVILGAASRNVPVVLDGFITSASALIAYHLCPLSAKYMLPSHLSMEKGHKWAMDLLGLKPYLDMNMRLGEGSGSAIAFGIVNMAVSMLNDMATFESAGVSTGNNI